MATSGARRRPQKYPVELRERAVRMVLGIREDEFDGLIWGRDVSGQQKLPIGGHPARAGDER